MKNILLIFFLLLLVKTSCSQDTVYQKNGEVKIVYHLREGVKNIVFTFNPAKTYPTYNLNKNEVSIIKYKSGAKRDLENDKTLSKNNTEEEMLTPQKSYSLSFDLSHLQSGPYTIGLEYRINKWANLRLPLSLGQHLFYHEWAISPYDSYSLNSKKLYSIGGDLHLYFAQSKHLGVFIGPSFEYGAIGALVYYENAESEYKEFTYTAGLISTGLKISFNKKVAMSFIGGLGISTYNLALYDHQNNYMDPIGKGQINLLYTL